MIHAPRFTPMFLLFAAMFAIFVFALVYTLVQSRRHTARTRRVLCPGCGTDNPAYSQFCRQCGRKF